MEEVKKQLKRIRNAGLLMLSAGVLLLLAGVLLVRGAEDSGAALRDSFLSFLGGFMVLLGAVVLYHLWKATRALGKMGPRTGESGH